MSVNSWRVPFEAYGGKEPYTFVSYAHRDHDAVFRDLNLLYRAGGRLWYDEGIDPGADWADEVARALHDCALFLVFLSPRAIESRNVRDEITFALNRQKPVVAVHLEAANLPPGLELRLNAVQALLRYRMDEAQYRQKLEGALLRHGVVRPDTDLEPDRIDSSGPAAAGVRADPLRFLPELEQLHRNRDWLAARRLGADMARGLLDRLDAGSGDFRFATKLMDVGVLLDDSGHLTLAKQCLLRVAEYLVQMAASQGESVEALDHLGMVYNNLGRLVRRHQPSSRSAEGYYRKSVEIFQLLYPDLSEDVNLGDRLGMAHSNLGNALIAQRKRDAARQAYQRAVEIYQQLAAEYPANAHLARRLQHARESLRTTEAPPSPPATSGSA